MTHFVFLSGSHSFQDAGQSLSRCQCVNYPGTTPKTISRCLILSNKRSRQAIGSLPIRWCLSSLLPVFFSTNQFVNCLSFQVNSMLGLKYLCCTSASSVLARLSSVSSLQHPCVGLQQVNHQERTFCCFSVQLHWDFSELHCLYHGGVLGFLCCSHYRCDS